MFLENQTNEEKKAYLMYLQSVATLSKLFSDSSTPYLNYRVVENMFCESFNALNLSRSDCSVDASKDGVGFGIKTFLNMSGNTLQKVAEFNKDAIKFRGKTPREIIEVVSELRNERLLFTKRVHGLTNLIYHCVVREPGKIKIYETPMHEVNIPRIRNVKVSSSNIITFDDTITEYSFNISKSTLYKRFYTENVKMEFEVSIVDNPYQYLLNITSNPKVISELKFTELSEEKPYIVLPLFSDRGTRNVPVRSGLNQWNADGRSRHNDEVYIPIPIWIHRVFPNFFPDRNTPFEMKLPNGTNLNTKICQENGKALMSNPNLALGKWILRDVMSLKNGELLTYERLEELDIDSVIIYKESDNTFSIDFAKFGSYDNFYEEYKK